MAAPIVTLETARQLYSMARPFCVTLKYDGVNHHTKRGWSSKWWQLTYDGKPGGEILCNHGATGSAGRKEPLKYDLTRAIGKGFEKIAKGYKYSTNTVKGMPKAPRPARTVLTGVFAEIRGVVEVGDDHFEAFDKDGLYLLDLTEEGANQVVDADVRITMTRFAS